MRRLLILILGAFVLTACGSLKPSSAAQADERSPEEQELEAQKQRQLSRLMASQNAPEADPYAVGSAATKNIEAGYLPETVGQGVQIQGYTLPSDDQIVWSDDENPEADLKFEKAFKKRPKIRGDWLTSFSEARRQSLATGKPILMWFTNLAAGKSPACKRLSREIFSGSEFKKWATEEVIRLRLDANGGAGSSNIIKGKAARRQNYVKELKERYRVLGLPAVVVLTPAGTVAEQFRGYSKSMASYYFQNLKDRVLTEKHNQELWRKKMTAKGYRTWTGRNGSQMFAKLQKFSQGRLYLVEPDGRRSVTQVSALSEVDQAWIDRQRAQRRS